MTGVGFHGVFLIHAKATGPAIWTKDWDTANYNHNLVSFEVGPLGALQTSNGDIVIADGTDAGHAVLLRYTAAGEKIGEFNYGLPDERISIFALSQDAQGNFYLGGNRLGTGTDRHFYLIKTTASGAELWSRGYPEAGRNALTGIALRADGTCLLAGQGYGGGNPGAAFLIGLDPEGYRDARSIAVSLKLDTDGDCAGSVADMPLEGWQIVFKSTTETFVRTLDANGYARQPVPDGVYEVSVNTPSHLWAICQQPALIQVDASGGPVFNTELLVAPNLYCALPTVSLTAPDLVRCEAGVFYIECHNGGTLDANAVSVAITLDPMLSLENTSLPYTLQNGRYYFEIGDLPVLASRRFSLTARLSCDAEIGQTHCVEAEAMPLPPCALPPDPGWSGASLRVDARCHAGTVQFTVTNAGSVDMVETVPYELFADGWRMQSGEIQLNAGQSWTLDYPANGRSVWFEALQVAGHPGNDRPGKAAEKRTTGLPARVFSICSNTTGATRTAPASAWKIPARNCPTA